MFKETKILEEGEIQIIGGNQIKIYLKISKIQSELSKIKHLKHKKQLDSSRIVINSKELYVIFESNQDREKFSQLYVKEISTLHNKKELKDKSNNKEDEKLNNNELNNKKLNNKKLNNKKLNNKKLNNNSSKSNDDENENKKNKVKIPMSLVEKYGDYICNGEIIIKDQTIKIKRDEETTIVAKIDQTFIQATPILKEFIIIYLKETFGKLYINLKEGSDLKILSKHLKVSQEQVSPNYISKILSSSINLFTKQSFLKIDIENQVLILSKFSLDPCEKNDFPISKHTKCTINPKKQSTLQLSISKNKTLVLDFGSKLLAQKLCNLINETKKEI